MSRLFKQNIECMVDRDIRVILDALAVARKRERTLKVFKSQTDALLQVISQETPARSPVTWSVSGVDVQTQTDDQVPWTLSEFEMGLATNSQLGASQATLSPVYDTLERVLNEKNNKGISNVLLSNWLVSLLAIIRRMNPTSVSFSNYYYRNESRAPGTPLHMLKIDAGICFMSALDSMGQYSLAGTGKGTFSDSELFIHYAVANMSCLHGSDVSYIQFCIEPLSCTLEQLTKAVTFTILDIVDFVKNDAPQDNIISVNSFPPSYIHVVKAVNSLLRTGGSGVNNSALVQFLPLTSSSGYAKADMTTKEKFMLRIIMRTALMWHMTYNLSSTVQNNCTIAYGNLLKRCMIRDGIVMHSLHSAGKAPYLSTGMLLPGLFAYLFYLSKEAGETQTLGSMCLSAPLVLHSSQGLENRLQSWRTEDFGVRDKMARFIVGDSVLKSSMTPTMAAFPGTNRDFLQGQIDSALISFLRDIFMHQQKYMMPSITTIDFLKETAVSMGYFQVSQDTKTTEYKMSIKDKMTHTAMTGFLKNPFLFKMHNTKTFDKFGREIVQTTQSTVVSTPVISQ